MKKNGMRFKANIHERGNMLDPLDKERTEHFAFILLQKETMT